MSNLRPFPNLDATRADGPPPGNRDPLPESPRYDPDHETREASPDNRELLPESPRYDPDHEAREASPDNRESLPESPKYDPDHETREASPDNRELLPESPKYDPDHETRKPGSYTFAHQKLDVYRVALEMARCSRALADRVPRGYRPFADQLIRSAGNTVLLIGEGANRYTAGQKRQRYTEARGESGETASTAELLATLRLVPENEAGHVERLAGRVAAMLTRLIQRYS